MDLLGFIVIITVLGGILLFGGKRLANEIKDIDLQSISGALLGIAIVARYLLFLFLVGPVMMIVHYIEWREQPYPTELWIDHPFALQLEQSEFPISDTSLGDLGFTTINNITGSVHFGQLSGSYYLAVMFSIAVWFFFAYQFLRHAKTVLQSLYNRTPFEQGNDLRVKKIACYGLAMALTINLGETIGGLLLSQSISIEGVEISPTELSLFRPLILFAVIFVMSEVFRVGRELKEENELTV